MHIKRTNQQREAALVQLEQAFRGLTIDELVKLKQEWALDNARAHFRTGEVELDLAALRVLHQVCMEKRTERREAGTTPEWETEKQIRALMKEHHVSRAVAKRHVERQAQKAQQQPDIDFDSEARRLARENHVPIKIAENFLKRQGHRRTETRQAPAVEEVQGRTNDVHNDDDLGLARADARIKRYVHEEE